MKFNFNFFKKKKEESLDWIDETLKNGFFNNNNEEINPDDDDLGMPDYTLDDTLCQMIRLLSGRK